MIESWNLESPYGLIALVYFWICKFIMARGMQAREIKRKFLTKEIDSQANLSFYKNSNLVEKNNPGGFRTYNGPRESIIPPDVASRPIEYRPIALIDKYLGKIPTNLKSNVLPYFGRYKSQGYFFSSTVKACPTLILSQ
jgi:hypothetical protein